MNLLKNTEEKNIMKALGKDIRYEELYKAANKIF